VAYRRLDIAEKSLKRGADVNAEYRNLTPLYLAVKLRQREAIAFLLGQPGLDPNYQGPNSLSALSLAVTSGDLYAVQLLLLLETIDLNYQCDKGITPSMHAVKSGETYIFQKLLSDPRTSLNIANFRGETLLHLAAR
jgi:ankyrin repeat protein